MDPNATLDELRQAIADLRAAQDGDSNDVELDAAHRVAELAEALDQWLSRGGFLPSAWDRGQS